MSVPTSQNSSCTATYHPSWKLSKLDEPDMWDTAKEVMMNSYVIYILLWPLHMDEQKQDDQLEPICNSSVPRLDIVLKTSWEQRTIETGGERGSGRFRAGRAIWWWWELLSKTNIVPTDLFLQEMIFLVMAVVGDILQFSWRSHLQSYQKLFS